jgi:tryptophan synthase alpha chain
MNLTTERKLLIPYVTGGITEDWTDYLLAYQEAGADAIEIGLPFSDPMLDGVTIQAASDRALSRGVTVEQILEDVGRIKDRVTVPLVGMTYTNLVLKENFCTDLKKAGFDGLIVPDLPIDEVELLESAAAAAGLDLVLLAAPSTSPQRLREICARSRGFIYAVTVMNTTGERTELAATAATLAAALKEYAHLPVVLGFGISTLEQARAASELADGVVVASALMRKVLDGASPRQLGEVVAELRKGLDG